MADRRKEVALCRFRIGQILSPRIEIYYVTKIDPGVLAVMRI